MEIPSHRSCAPCRSLKIRCMLDETNPGICQRCARFGRECVFTPIQKRKQRKKTETRVTDLEREMSVLRALLKQKEATGNVAADPQKNSTPGLLEGGNPTSQAYGASGWSSAVEATVPPQKKDIVDRGLASMDMARQLVEQYKIEMYPHHPIVYISPTCTADQLRRTKPMLFLAILAGAAGKDYPEIAIKLDQAVLEEYANRTVLNSEKSLELVQSLLVSGTWYQPPGHLNQFKYYEYNHMAAMMVADIGIGTRPLEEERLRMKREAPSSTLRIQGYDLEEDGGTTSIESRRTFLAALVKSAGIMITSRRPAMMRITSYAKECLDHLDQSPQAAPGDRILTAWTRLLIIADEIASAFTYDDPGAVASILDVKTQLMIGAFLKRLTDWRRGSPEFDYAPTLRMTYYTVRLYLCEVALHVDHWPEDFKVPYHMGPVRSCNDQAVPVKPVIEALAELVESSHALMDAFMTIDANIARALPLGMFVRVSYAAFILAKLCTSAVHEHSQLAPLIDVASLHAQSYMDRTLLHVRCAIGVHGSRLPAIFLNLMGQMREWCIHPELVEQIKGEARIGGSRPHGVGQIPQQRSIDRIRSIEDVSGSKSSTEARHRGLDSRSSVLTASFEENYESFGNEEAVRRAAIHGLLDETVDISDTLAQLDTVLPSRASGDEVPPEMSVVDKQLFTPAETIATTSDDGQGLPWSIDLGEMESDNNAFSFLGDVDTFTDDAMVDLDEMNLLAQMEITSGWHSAGVS
ncbi:MAG: hypothetical protein M4579_005207 [Chaenotheca gracillima]|nr:MAG: hypothetical protein M4579_005207 [Chaenotheca gracillima]